MVVQLRTKTAGRRILAVPDFAVDMVRRRLESSRRPDTELVFLAPPAGTLREPTNVSGDLLQLLDSFTARPATAPVSSQRRRGQDARSAAPSGRGSPRIPPARPSPPACERPASSPRQVADPLGHPNPSMTPDVYFGRQLVSAEAARMLGR